MDLTGTSKTEAVYRSLHARIEDGTYAPGQRLVLGRVAQEHGVSAVPVREAIRKLEAEGLVDYQPNVGAAVRGIDDEAYHEAMQALAYLEGFATGLSAPHVSKSTLRKAQSVNRRMAQHLKDFDPLAMTHANHEFHQLLCSGCPNAHLLDLMEREWRRLGSIRRSTFSFVPGRAAASIKEHDHLVTLISDNAPEREIELAARAHKLGTLTAYINARTPEP